MEGLVGAGVVAWLFLLVLILLWIRMPFAIFGTKPILRELLAEQKKTNQLLQDQADRAKAIRIAAASLPSAEVRS